MNSIQTVSRTDVTSHNHLLTQTKLGATSDAKLKFRQNIFVSKKFRVWVKPPPLLKFKGEEARGYQSNSLTCWFIKQQTMKNDSTLPSHLTPCAEKPHRKWPQNSHQVNPLKVWVRKTWFLISSWSGPSWLITVFSVVSFDSLCRSASIKFLAAPFILC